MAEENKNKSERYVSKYFALKLVRVPAFTKEVGGGRTVVVPGKRIEFEQGVFETADKDEIKFLDEHANNGTIFMKVKKNIASERADMLETLEEREARIEAKEKELGISNKKVDKESQGEDEGDDFDKMSGPELKEELKKRELPVGGRVDELRERLRENESEKNKEEAY